MLERRYQAMIVAAVLGVIGTVGAAYIQRPRPIPAAPLQDSQPIVPQLPFPASLEALFYPSGWMGDGRQGTKYLTLSHVADTVEGKDVVVTRIEYQPGPDGWGGIYWQYPDGNWGDIAGRPLVGAREVTFLARGEQGGEIVEFKSGGIRGKHRDAFERSVGKSLLTTHWQSVRISLEGADLRSVIGILGYVVAAADNKGQPVTVRLANLLIR